MEKDLTKDEKLVLEALEIITGGDLNSLLADKDMTIKNMQLYKQELINQLDEALYNIVGKKAIDAELGLLIYNWIFKNKYEKAKEDGDFNSMLYASINMDVIEAGLSPEIERSILKIK